MHKKIFPVFMMIAAVSLTFAWSSSAPRRTLRRFDQGGSVGLLSSDSVWLSPLVESTLLPEKVTLLQSLTLTLDSPSILRLGDVSFIRLKVTLDAGNSETGPADGFASYNVIAEARLELPRIFVSPPNMVSQPIHPGQSITFTWSVPAEAVGEYRGTAWFFLRFMPKGSDENLNGQDSIDVLPAQVNPSKETMLELPVAAIPFGVRVVSLLGMKGSTVRTIGIAGLFTGFLIALPLILDRFYRVRRSPS